MLLIALHKKPEYVSATVSAEIFNFNSISTKKAPLALLVVFPWGPGPLDVIIHRSRREYKSYGNKMYSLVLFKMLGNIRGLAFTLLSSVLSHNLFDALGCINSPPSPPVSMWCGNRIPKTIHPTSPPGSKTNFKLKSVS